MQPAHTWRIPGRASSTCPTRARSPAAIHFAKREEGLVTAPGSPKGIRRLEDLADAGVQFINREPGSGSRALVDRLLAKAGVPEGRVNGYRHEASGHLAAAHAVASGQADCCVATRSAAQAFGLGFVPLKTESYDLIFRRDTLRHPAVQALLDTLQRARLRQMLRQAAGYDTGNTGSTLI